jgi:hypothetical protein
MRIRDLVLAAASRLLARLQREGVGAEHAPPASAEDPWKDFVRSIRLEVHETAKPVLLCFGCNKLALFDEADNVIRSWLLGAGPACPVCGQLIDVWMNTLLALTSDKGLAIASQVGARHTAIAYRLPVGTPTGFDVRDKGVPKDATILRIRHTAGLANGVSIVDIDGNDSARAPSFTVRVLGVALAEGASTEMQATTTVTWAHHDADDDGRRSLNQALMAIADGRLEEAIIPANVPVEVTLAAVLEEHLRDIGVSNTRLTPFLRDAATYSHQLNVLLPIVLWGTGVPLLAPHLVGVLNRLRGLRNGIGHRGKSEQPLTRAVIGECVAAAVFGFHYARLAGELLSAVRSELAAAKAVPSSPATA